MLTHIFDIFAKQLTFSEECMKKHRGMWRHSGC